MNKDKRNNIISLVLNVLMVILVTYAICQFFTETGVESGSGNMDNGGSECFIYFTNDSNIFAALCSLILIPFNIKSIIKNNNELPKWALILKYVGTNAVTLTLMVVILYLGPVISYKAMFEGCCLELHLICPLLSIISFIFFEKGIKLNKKQAIVGIIPMIIYGSIYLTNVIFTKVWTDFYHFNVGGLWYISLVIITILTYLFGLVLTLLHNKFENK